MTNPYESSAAESINRPFITSSETIAPLSKWVTIPVGVFIGGIGSGFFAGVLAIVFVCMLGSMFGFRMLDQLLVIGLPVLVLPGGMLGGLIVGSLWKWHRAYWLAMIVASLPAFVFFFMLAWSHEPDKNPREQFVTTAILSTCMISASALGLKILAWLLAAIEKKRMERLNYR